MASRRGYDMQIPEFSYDPAPAMDGFSSLVQLGSAMSSYGQRQGDRSASRAAQPDAAAFIDSSERTVSRLRSRQQMFQIQNEIQNAVRLQESKEADYSLEPKIAELSAYAGSENWAGVYSKRREIMTHPAFAKATEVKKIVSELDMGLKNWGSEITTDGREVSFQDVARMAGSSDAAEQKQAFRILALRSESSDSFIDSLPMDQINTRDPLFRAQLKSFIRDNPRVNRDDYVKYKQAESEYLGSLKQQFAHDPVLAAQMIASPEVKGALDKMRAGMLTGKAGNETDWLPRLNASDIALKDQDLTDLGEALKVQIGRQGDTMAMELTKGIGEFFSGNEARALEKVQNNPKLASLSGAGFLPTSLDDKSLADYVTGLAGPAAWASVVAAKNKFGLTTFKATQKVLAEIGKKSILAGGAESAYVLGASGAGRQMLTAAGAKIASSSATSLAARGLGAVTGGPLAWGVMAAVEGVRAVTHQRAIDKTRAEADSALRTIISGKTMLLTKVQAGGADGEVFSTLDQLASAMEKFNLVAQRAGAEYQLDLPHLFGQAQWQAIHARMMLNSKTRQQIMQSGMDQRVGFQPMGQQNQMAQGSGLPMAQGPASLPAAGVQRPGAMQAAP